jgi:AraC-like DNA-binding protein
MAENGARRLSTRRARAEIFEEAVAILWREYPARISMAEVSRCVSVSPRQLQRIFAERSGMGFRSYLTAVRMSAAADLLSASDTPIKNVAAQVGYLDASQFTKAFKRIHGISPMQWRARTSRR